MGNHHELIAHNGVYNRLYKIQFKTAPVEPDDIESDREMPSMDKKFGQDRGSPESDIAEWNKDDDFNSSK